MTRLKASKSAHRWRTGHSSSSNPKIYKFRNQAKCRELGGHVSSAKSSSALTAEALARHDDGLESDITMTKEDDQFTMEGKKSARSAWTLETEFAGGTYNGTAFHCVQRLWNSSLASHRQICAVLAAVTEVMKSQGGSMTDNEYFAALMTALESAENEEIATALAVLLSIVIDRISNVVLKSKFSLCSKVLSNKLRVYSSTQTSSLLKSLVVCLAALLAAQEKAVWSESSTVQMLHSLLSHTVSSKPKVRKAAQQAICNLVKHAPKSIISSEVASFCVHELERHGGSTDSRRAVYTLALLRGVIVMLSRPNLKSSCECLLRLMTLGNAVVMGLVMEVFVTLFSSESTDLTARVNAQLINALNDYQPSVKDMQPLQAWLNVVKSAHVNLQRLDYHLCYTHLPHFFSTCVKCLLSPHDMIIQVASEAMKDVLLKCVAPHVEKVVLAAGGSLKGKNSILEKIFRLIESGLKYRYHAAWCQVLEIIQIAFNVMGKACSDIIVPQVVMSLCNLHGIPNFSYIPQLEAAVGAAVQSVGPRLVLEAVPLELDRDDVSTEFSRAWLLPVLKRYIQRTELDYFTTVLLPLAARLRNKAVMLSNSHRKLEAKIYNTLQSQIWFVLPSFCRNPVDLKQSFKNIAQILGVALNERPELRNTICHALCLLIEGSRGTDEQTVLSHFSKNFLPILFNLHTSEPDLMTSSLLSCVAAFLSVSDQQLVNSLFGKVGVKLTSDIDKATKQAVMELALLMVPYVSQKSLSMLYKAISVLLESDDNALQKRAYKILQQMCSCESDQHQSFVENHLDALQTKLLTSLSSAATSSKRARLKCLSAIVHRLRKDGTNFISLVTPEVILCTKEVNEGARTEAYRLLVELANAQNRCCDDTYEVNITRYFHLVLAGLAATSPHMLSATILSLGCLAYEFKDLLSHSMIQKLLSSMKVLLASRSREVIKATLGFIKVIISILEPSDLMPHVQELIFNMVSWSKDTKYHFRQQSRLVFQRLARKLGYEMIFNLVPESHRKLVAHVRKTAERAKRKKAGKQESRDKNVMQSYEEILCSSEEEEPTRTKKFQSRNEQAAGIKGKRKSDQQAWIQEGPEHEPIDLLDRSVVKRVVATDPFLSQTKPQLEQFEESSDGKLIIKDAENDVVDVSYFGNVESSSRISDRKRKRTKSGSEDVTIDLKETVAKRPHLGIHRTLPTGQMKFPDYGVEYRAKKAKGDIKLKGKSDPYAYVPFDFGKLNKRKQAKLTGQFRGVMSAASKGVQRAQKSRTRSHIRKKRSKSQR